jgi:alpha-L-fucosidase
VMKKHLMYVCAVFLVSVLFWVETATAQYIFPPKMNWWYEARFGMFIHFGSYSYLGRGEWAFSVESWTKTNYQTQVSAHFNPVNFNAGEIARLAKNAGMKYLVITAKHHEGFCMWPTEVQSFKDVTGTKMYDLHGFTEFTTRDVLQELKDSCDAQGIKFCLYYSIIDWNHSSQTGGGFTSMVSMEARAAYIEDMKTQLNELVTRYHPAILWFDGDWDLNLTPVTLTDWWNAADGRDLYNYVVSLDSTILVNERVKRGAGLGDYECPEQTVPGAPLGRPWETCQTMNNAWGYNAGSENTYKTSKTMIQELVKVVSRDGNYLLNIGPRGDGSVTNGSKTILNGFGSWMSIYSESIYGTTRSPYSVEPKWGFYTKKTGKLYVHVFTWPANRLLKVPSLTNTINKIYLLNDTTSSLSYYDSTGYIRITVPVNAPDSINSVVVIDVSGVPVASTQYVKVTSIKVNNVEKLSYISTDHGTLHMTATASPSTASDKTVSWAVGDTTIASIDIDGLLTAKGNGTVEVIATARDGSDIQGKLKILILNQTGISDHPTQFVPNTPILEQNYPNPFNPSTMISFTLPTRSFVTLKILDLFGREVVTLVSEEFPAGSYSRQFQADAMASGVYYYRMETHTIAIVPAVVHTQTKKLILLR